MLLFRPGTAHDTIIWSCIHLQPEISYKPLMTAMWKCLAVIVGEWRSAISPPPPTVTILRCTWGHWSPRAPCHWDALILHNQACSITSHKSAHPLIQHNDHAMGCHNIMLYLLACIG